MAKPLAIDAGRLQQIGVMLIDRRERLGLQVKEAAALAHVSVRHYQRIEKGHMRTSRRIYLSIANALGIPPEEIDPTVDRPQKPLRTEADEQVLRSAMRKIATLPAVAPTARVPSVGVAIRQAAIESA